MWQWPFGGGADLSPGWPWPNTQRLTMPPARRLSHRLKACATKALPQAKSLCHQGFSTG